MGNPLIVILTERYNLLSYTVRRLKDEVGKYPEGKLKIRQHANRSSYYYLSDDSEKYLARSDSELIRQMVQKDYIKEIIKMSECEMKMLKDIIDSHKGIAPEDVFDNLIEARKKYATPICFGNKIADDWANEPYDKPIVLNGFDSLKGDKVRSKSELIIADRLLIKGVPYRYECPVMINGKIIHPDFTVLRRSDNKLVYHEHCGMVDKPEYAENMVTRINDYNKDGIYLGDRLFLTFETSNTPLDVTAIDNLIDTHFR
ncbi:MAG: hypothetical protein IKZ42_03375 [Clostridiales bacterium]|nr:hypothetical protein [Clostridiales bacterium]